VRSLIRANGLLFIAATLAMIATLVAGLFITSWFTAVGSEENAKLAALAQSEASFRLTTIEVCSFNSCVSTPSWNFPDAFGLLVVPLIVAGIAFAVVVLRIALSRIGEREVRRSMRGLAYGLAIVTLGLALGCMFFAAPSAMAYDISVSPSSASFMAHSFLGERVSGVTQTPGLGLGGFLVLFGIFLGTFVAYGSSPEPVAEEPVAEEVRPSRRFRAEPAGPQRGPETDPFRAPPAGRPIAIVRHGKPAPTPIAAGSGDQPRLLR
jgi:hypothetical protein